MALSDMVRRRNREEITSKVVACGEYACYGSIELVLQIERALLGPGRE